MDCMKQDKASMSERARIMVIVESSVSRRRRMNSCNDFFQCLYRVVEPFQIDVGIIQYVHMLQVFTSRSIVFGQHVDVDSFFVKGFFQFLVRHGTIQFQYEVKSGVTFDDGTFAF